MAVAIVVDAKAEGGFRQEPGHRKCRRGKGEVAGHERAHGVDDLLGRFVEGRMTAEHLRAVGELHGRAPHVADREHEFDVARVLVRRAVDVTGIREHGREATMCAEIGRRDRDGGPHHREGGNAIAGLREHRGAVLERVDVGPMHFVRFGFRGFDRHLWIGITRGADRAQAQVLAHH